MSYMNILKICGISGVYIYIAFMSARVNLDEDQRGYQYAMPVLAAVFCFPVMCAAEMIGDKIISLIELIANLLMRIPFIGKFLSTIFQTIYSTLKLSFGLQLLYAFILMTAFYGFKKGALGILKDKCIELLNFNNPQDHFKWAVKELHEKILYHFYNSVRHTGINGHLTEKLKLKDGFLYLGRFFMSMYYVSISMGISMCSYAYKNPSDMTFFYPVFILFATIVIGEIAFSMQQSVPILNSKKKKQSKKQGFDADVLQSELESLFGDRITLSDTMKGPAASKPVHEWKEEAHLDDELGQILGVYFDKLQESGSEINADYVAVTRMLFEHKSVVIHNPFYHDMTEYLLLPMFHEVLNHNKCLIVCGRLTNEDDIADWVTNNILNVTQLPKLWKVDKLNDETQGKIPDVGILGFKSLYNSNILKANKEFFKETTLIILLEPSNLLGTGQIGLRSVVQLCERAGKTLTFCVLDRNADGLVDTLSHVFRQSLTEVIASPIPQNGYNRMFWDVNGPGMQGLMLPGIGQYFGIGTEIAMLAMKNDVDNIHWYSGNRVPLLDLKWRVEQYYSPICEYISAPGEQSEIARKFRFHQNLWHAGFDENAFILVEDEFNNLFEMSRTFAARIKQSGFINVLAENYMLRDYMCDNPNVFSKDQKMIPTIVPDYVQTPRNFVLRTLMLMAMEPMEESVLSKELALHGCESKNSCRRLCELIERHTGISDIHIQTIREDVGIGGSKYTKFSYLVEQAVVDSVFDSALKLVYFVVENEELGRYPIGNRLMGHVEQTLLPGQFFSYEGKYYEVRKISPQNGIIVRRAAEHLKSRVRYRQLRNYAMKILKEHDEVQNLRGMKMQMVNADIEVTTDGYLEMDAGNSLKDADLIELDSVRKRSIPRKDVLRLTIPDITEDVLFTLCLLFNELFQTIYPNESDYIIAAPSTLAENIHSNEEYSSKIRSLVPALERVDAGQAEEMSIYFIEDSCIDLGILVSIERNILRLMEIIYDYLDWYKAGGGIIKARESVMGKGADQPEAGQEPEEGDEPEEGQEPEEGDEPEEGQEPEDTDQPDTDQISFMVHYDETAAGDVSGEDEELVKQKKGKQCEPYKMYPYLLYGYKAVPEWIDISNTLSFLGDHGFASSNLHKARTGSDSFDDGSTYVPGEAGTHYCDFCGAKLEPGKYDVLKDGRERCPECSKTAVKTRRQFKKVYKQTLTEMEQIFGISIDIPIKVRMKNAKDVNDLPDVTYKPTPRFDSRVLGYARRDKKPYELTVENGAPLWKMKSTLVHELTHIWQYINWEVPEIQQRYNTKELHGLAYEGMAVWTEIQYLVSCGQIERAIMYKKNRDMDPSVYGEGMKVYIQLYPIEEAPKVAGKKTPFTVLPPI